ncbi:hypothetical protein [Ferrovum myxofaciens]|uniref:hypothetical protein n=1 Tax=Ferrovum myxofaciens TaxID=416213 RepID=UPI0004E13E7F|nr:hypothetical protein [Ferrovum myxofaciens]
MSKPARLTLKQALEAIKKPLKRWGDLIIVQVITGCLEGWGPKNGELRSTLMPNRPKPDGTFDPVFPLMTASWLEQWYADGGWVESLWHFSEVELALFQNYRGGTFKPGAWAGSIGDASAFERDCEEAATYEPALTAEVARTIRGNILRQHQKYLVPAQTGEKFLSGRKPGTGGPIRKCIAKHLKKTPSMTNESLWDAIKGNPPTGFTVCDNRAGKYIEGPAKFHNMNFERFCNVCAEERRATKK